MSDTETFGALVTQVNNSLHPQAKDIRLMGDILTETLSSGSITRMVGLAEQVHRYLKCIATSIKRAESSSSI